MSKIYDMDFLASYMYNLFLFAFQMDYPVLFLYNKKIPEEYALRNGENKWKKDDVIRDFVNSVLKPGL